MLLLLAAGLASAGDAAARSIVYIKGGDVWLARSDGKSARALTKDGTRRNSYRSPTQSSKGTIAALRGRRNVYLFNRRGRRIGRPRDVAGGPTRPFDPIAVDAEISPDGRKLATTLWLVSQDQNPKPGEPTGTDFGTTVWYTSVKGGKLLGQTRDGQSPSWVGSSRLLVWAPNVYHSPDAYFVALASPAAVTGWFQDRAVVDPLDPTDGAPLDDGELTRAGDKLALIRGPNTTASADQTSIRLYSVSSLSARPAASCDLHAAANAFYQHPSWSPDGARLVWSERSGIWVTTGSGGCGAPKLLIRGGAQPDWGPARVPARRQRR